MIALIICVQSWRIANSMFESSNQHLFYIQKLLLTSALLEYGIALYKNRSFKKKMLFASWPPHLKGSFGGIISYTLSDSQHALIDVQLTENTRTIFKGSCLVDRTRAGDKEYLTVSSWRVGQ
jgi:hypothetical protein